jgi:RNA polymerase sigma-70 factor (ECF subfamily)
MTGRLSLTYTSERDLIAKAVAGDSQAKTLIVLEHEDLVYNLALKLLKSPEDAEGILQETFLKVFQKLSLFRAESSLKTWIYRIAMNEALMVLRQRKADFVSVDDTGDEQPSLRHARMLKSLDRDPLEMMLDAEFKSALEAAMAELPDSWRIAFVLKDIEGLSLQEIAEELNTTVPAVKALLHRGRTALRNRLAEFIETHPSKSGKASAQSKGQTS